MIEKLKKHKASKWFMKLFNFVWKGGVKFDFPQLPSLKKHPMMRSITGVVLSMIAMAIIFLIVYTSVALLILGSFGIIYCVSWLIKAVLFPNSGMAAQFAITIILYLGYIATFIYFFFFKGEFVKRLKKHYGMD